MVWYNIIYIVCFIDSLWLAKINRFALNTCMHKMLKYCSCYVSQLWLLVKLESDHSASVSQYVSVCLVHCMHM